MSPLAPTLFDIKPDVLWVQHCSEGLVPRAAVEAARTALERELRPWELSFSEWLNLPGRVREAASRLFGFGADDLTLVSSTSAGLAVIAQAYPWRAGDEVLLPLGEFPSNVWPWKALEPRGILVREVSLWKGHLAGAACEGTTPPTAAIDPEAALLAAITPATRVLSVSWVRFQDGLRLDLPRLAAGCAERGVDLVVDGVQGAGTFRVPSAEIGAFASGVYKGLLAPQGLGLLATSPGLRERLFPLGSWLSVEQGSDFRRPSTDFARGWLRDGRKFEQGGPNVVSLSALEASLRTLLSAEIGAIEAHVKGLQRVLLDGLAAIPAWAAEAGRLRELLEAERLGAIASLHHGGRGGGGLQAILDAGQKQGIFSSVREGYLRIALHGWHSDRDIGRLLAWLERTPAP